VGEKIGGVHAHLLVPGVEVGRSGRGSSAVGFGCHRRGCSSGPRRRASGSRTPPSNEEDDGVVKLGNVGRRRPLHGKLELAGAMACGGEGNDSEHVRARLGVLFIGWEA
jgi:hypothetical protein